MKKAFQIYYKDGRTLTFAGFSSDTDFVDEHVWSTTSREWLETKLIELQGEGFKLSDMYIRVMSTEYVPADEYRNI